MDLARFLCKRGRPRSIMMSPVVVNQDQLVSPVHARLSSLWSSLTACAITNCFTRNGLCTRQIPVQTEQNPIFRSNFLPFCTELYYPRAIYCRTDGKVSIRRAREVGVALPKNVPKSVGSKHNLSKTRVRTSPYNNKTIQSMKLRNNLYLHEGQ